MKNTAKLLLLTIIVYSLLPTLNLIKFEKKYTYEQESQEINLKQQKVYKDVSANNNTLSPDYNRFESNLSFSSAKDMITFKVEKEFEIDNENDIQIKVTQNGKSIITKLDINAMDGENAYYYTEPIFIKSTKDINYEILTAKNIEINTIVAEGLDTKSFNYKVVLDNNIEPVNGEENIVSRSDWGADEELRYEDSKIWKSILAKQGTSTGTKDERQNEIINTMNGIYNGITEGDKSGPTNARLQIKAKSKELEAIFTKNNVSWKTKYMNSIVASLKAKLINKHLQINFADELPVKTIKEQNGRPLARNIDKIKYPKKIVIHHTDSNLDGTKDDTVYIRGIYYYHAITLGRGDIGYNYIIGQRGKIYEGRAGGDYVVGAHASYNNRVAVGISILGNYENDKLVADQENGINNAIKFLSTKYGINISGSSMSHKECLANENCLMKDYNSQNLSGHKDVGYTACPGKNIYNELEDFRKNASYSANLSPVENPEINSINTIKQETVNPIVSKGPTIKIKLSYPQNSIKIKSFFADRITYLSLLKIQNAKVSGKFEYNFETAGKDKIALIVGKKRVEISGKIKITADVLEIPSWSRIPSWDTEKKYNDNKFRSSIILYNDNGTLVVLNEILMEDYLKGLGEVGNTDSPEKAKTILTAARTYALFYTDVKNRKFPGAYYDGSDSPDVFQKYLGYSLELRNTKVNKLVDETNGMIITLSGQIIKPWYFNQSNGTTKSFVEYCKANKISSDCENNIQAKYLKSVVDPAGGTEFKGHGVGISGAGAEKMAQDGKKYDEIIKYFLTGVNLKKLY
ncbi:MAG: N-acetylmuramoyl-L-alanine amidase [Candidatus Gracilibacteria bacterium]|nr:N-acetylmuramoyl-L-alanine amidase [Candidatus Gracilibacteria bacterium]